MDYRDANVELNIVMITWFMVRRAQNLFKSRTSRASTCHAFSIFRAALRQERRVDCQHRMPRATVLNFVMLLVKMIEYYGLAGRGDEGDVSFNVDNPWLRVDFSKLCLTTSWCRIYDLCDRGGSVKDTRQISADIDGYLNPPQGPKDLE